MSDTMWWLLAALTVELLLILLVLLGASWWRNRAARRRDAAAIEKLVARVKTARPDREAAIAEFLQTRMGMSGDALEQARLALWRAETILLQRFAAVYRRRDAGAAGLFDTDVCTALGPYLALQTGGSSADVGPVDLEELELLRAENERLTEELRITMETMSRMLDEYSTMFAGAEADGAALPAILDGDAVAPIAMDAAAGPDDPVAASGEGAAMAAVDAPAEGRAALQGGSEAPVDLDVVTAEPGLDAGSGVGNDAVDDADTAAGELPEGKADVRHTAAAGDAAATEGGQGTLSAPASAALVDDALAALLEEGSVEVMAYDDEPASAEVGADAFDPMEVVVAGDDGLGFDADLFDAVEPPGDTSSLDEADAPQPEVRSQR